ncbi:MAG: nitrate/nitrite two-component system sensor histidine kinase NarQ [Mixta calida]|uniref:Sensor protein n=1 Tax=Mixta calida TaxID=665913 RepID=A0ABM6S4E9_9GAMM|nr:nitrate/nitrite two-component system sensor histidine kinase NarQ [Mixta calida]MBS6057672.1 nitrate/nitrite two-component system sensor histidine kinase NarQ [Pantoea sp.]HCW48185.1 nitrate/nitrite two-component system sensor histidine kinase NarQ [Erwiniaceae bacterium]AUY26142.1 nitrate/nitrite two-component system sensor histidine kinase NarQ [Mixta calida]KAF0858104.1 nitrate/nitrite sensor protein NarQ [Mixta calida B021323]MDU2734332.1 nitrate/nitrite two-component system sensor hist
MLKRSVTSSIARALAGIVILSVLSTSLALLTLSGSLRDAEMINLAGSLRMQSYRLAWDSDTHSPELETHLYAYQQSLNAPVLQHLNRFYVPENVRNRYRQLKVSWPMLQADLLSGEPQRYSQHVAGYVGEIDRFVYDLQRYAERKMQLVALTSGVGFIAIVALAFWTIRLTRRQVVKPLNRLVQASRYIEQGNFHYPPLETSLENELGLLANAFNRMSGELERHYSELENTVKARTADLLVANQTMTILYEASQALAVSSLSHPTITEVMEIVFSRAKLTALALDAGESWQFALGTPQPDKTWQHLALKQENQPGGELRWQEGDRHTPAPLMQSVGNLLSRAIWIHQAQKQQQQLLLMEERATIARELHDSLAQALSFLRIQLTLLKRTITTEQQPAQQIISDFDQALAEAYRQLRELLNTFRLSVDEACLPAALQAMLTPLQQQTSAEIALTCASSFDALTAQQQVHVLQIVREAVLNAIRHADARRIEVSCVTLESGEHHITISDDGCGLDTVEEPAGHYGLTIMHERAQRLGGTLQMETTPAAGTRLLLRFPMQATETVTG